MKYYLKAIWYLLLVALATGIVIGGLAVVIYFFSFVPIFVWLPVVALLFIPLLVSFIKEIADDMKWEDWKKRNE